MKNTIKLLIQIVIIGICVFVISNFLIQICFVKGPSMEPTLRDGQILFVKKFSINPKKNDIAVIKHNKKIIIKRIVGTPNDKIFIKNGYVFVNDIQFDDRKIEDAGNALHEIILGEDEYFVLGDNRQQSIDSRYDEIGIIHYYEIIGIVL